MKGAAWLTDEDGDRVLRGVGCSERGEGRDARNVRVWVTSSSEWGGVGTVMPRPTNSSVILVF